MDNETKLVSLFVTIIVLLLVPFLPARTLNLARVSAAYSYAIAIVFYIVYELLFQRWFSYLNIRIDLVLLLPVIVASSIRLLINNKWFNPRNS